MRFLESDAERELKEQSPGPCDYDPSMPTFQPEYIEQAETRQFKPWNIDRFGDPVDKSKIQQDPLGPGR